MNYNKLRTQIGAYIKRNGRQEITGPVLNGVLNAMVDSLASGSLYAGILSPQSVLPSLDSNVFMLCGPGKYSVGGSSAEVGIGQLGIVSNASGQWKMETVQVVDVLQEVDSDSAQTSPNPASVSATMKYLDSYLKLTLLPGNLASIIPDWDRFFSKIDTISDITDPLDFSETNYLTKEENLKDACVQLDEEVKAANDNIEILGAEAKNLEKAKQDKLAPGTGIAIQGNVISCTLDPSVFVVKQSLPEQPETGKENKIYVVPNPDGQGDDIYDEYMWVNGDWEKLGSFKASVDLSAYQTKQDDSLKTESKTVVGAINELHADKLDVNNYFSKIGSSAMRPVYEACGAVWNEETGYYELNGLTDITEEEMLTIYAVFSDYKIEDISWKYTYTKARTNICPKYATYAIKSYPNFNGQRAFYYSDMEVIKISDYASSSDYGFPLSQGGNMFDSCERLKRIIGILWVDKSNSLYGIFNRCRKLEDVQIYGLSLPISFSDSPLLNYASLDCLITNAANTAAITVTVHPTTYSYLSGTAQPSADVGGTTEEWQALMTTAAGKQISFATKE